MIYPMIFISLFLLSGCSALKSKPDSNCRELLKEAAMAGCQIQGVVNSGYTDQCAVACK